MNVTINGELCFFEQKLTLSGLIELRGFNSQHIVIELNRNVVQRQDFGSVELQDKDVLELIEFVAGG